MEHIHKEEVMKRASLALQDATPLEIIITIRDAWDLVSVVQLAIRHPGMSKTQKKRLVQLAHLFEKQIVLHLPEVEDALLMGWHDQSDRENNKSDDEM